MSKEEKGGVAMPSYINVTPFTRQYHQIKALENQVRQLKEHISAIENYNEQFLPHSELMERHISSQLFNIKDISVSEMKEIAGSIISKMKEMNEFDYVNNQILFLDYLMTHLGYERILFSQTDDLKYRGCYGKGKM